MSKHTQVCGTTGYWPSGPSMASNPGEFVRRSGDQMMGSLLLWRDPVIDMESVTKRYVDGRIGALVDTITGVVSASMIPVNPAVAGGTNVQAALEGLEDLVMRIDCGTY